MGTKLFKAIDWAKNNRDVKRPAVIGAVIDLGHCLNLTDYRSTAILELGYDLLCEFCKANGIELPINRDVTGNRDKLIRDLDCAVIEQIHDFNRHVKKARDYDSVRGIFFEGGPVYEGSGFMRKTHVQLCIRNINCIKGYFSPLEANEDFEIP